jgi:hypothetical protein
MLEDGSLRSHGEDEFVVSMWLDVADLSNQVDSFSPAQIPGQLSGEQACVQKVKIMASMCTHSPSILAKNYQEIRETGPKATLMPNRQ